MKLFLTLFLCLSQAWAHEKELKTRADLFATGVFKEQKDHAWPFPLLSIGHNMQSYQFYGGAPYWHDGLDVRSAVDQPIHASVGGKVVNIENYVRGNPLYWEIAILDDEGFVWKYHHVAQESIPQEVLSAYKTKGRIATGAFIGNVVRWGITSFGERYHHLHLLVVAKDGQYINPFLMMTPLPDTKAPVINRIGIAKNHRPIEGNEVSGPHALFLDASDLTMHDRFILPPYKISYSLNKKDSVTVWEFIHLPSGKNDTDYITDFYMNGTCGDYNCRKFFFNLNFTTTAPRGTMRLSPGMHEVEVTVEDIVGNKATKSYQWKVI